MAPSAVSATKNGDSHSYKSSKHQNGHANTNNVELPLRTNGSLDSYAHLDLTPCIGREFPTANLVNMMQASNSDELLKELALTSTHEPTSDHMRDISQTNMCQSPNAAQSSSANKTT